MDWMTRSALREAWRRVRRNRGMPGADKVNITAFSQGVETRLGSLSDQLRTGRYHPSPLLRIDIDKPSGGTRRLLIPSVRDRVAQGACAAALDRILDPHMSRASFAYRRGLSVEDAIGRVIALSLQGGTHALDADIEKFFDRIRHDVLKDMLGRKIRARATLDVVSAWLGGFSKSGLGVAQGSPISPLLANWYLTGFDHVIDRRKARLVRYADDFLVITRSERAARLARDRVQERLEPLGLTLNIAKTHVVTLHAGVEFLGRRLHGSPLRVNAS